MKAPLRIPFHGIALNLLIVRHPNSDTNPTTNHTLPDNESDIIKTNPTPGIQPLLSPEWRFTSDASHCNISSHF